MRALFCGTGIGPASAAVCVLGRGGRGVRVKSAANGAMSLLSALDSSVWYRGNSVVLYALCNGRLG